MARRSLPSTDYSETLDGPALIALRSDAGPASQFRLGTQDYDWHRHRRGQLFCVGSGLMQVHTRQGSWLMPAQRAGWIPAGLEHRVSVSGVLSGWSVLIVPQRCGELPQQPCVLAVSELMRALVERAASWTGAATLTPSQQRLCDVLLDELALSPALPLHLPLPRDRRLLKLTRAVLAQPGSARSQQDWASWAGLSVSTLSRLCVAETGLSFARWRQQAALAHALQALARGTPVARIADELGYGSASAFIAMFRREMGHSPRRYAQTNVLD
ncbi:helix-turn-helix transcriptional regulator [Paucibacter sp. APW11]|uniref:Helix-turn-helix transcriptional regulator n=1 Tax=Roseateles aquae TaxID=3077235 RepID=A0ABU3PCK7_9BURK|nr:helix-turn-helix transcriptional regulator [Paucibacter sp. APW11]MDT9000321.1 helix-turn-helix transcriptional regulator [Paucibacter sp. APW11]